MVRRILAGLLLLLMAGGLVFATGEAEQADTSGERVDLEILIWWAKRFADEDALIAALGERVNADLTIATIPHNVYFDQITTKIAANDLPVMYKVQIPTTRGFRMMQDLVLDGRLTPLEEVVAEHDLDNWGAYLARPELNHLRQDDGEIYASPIWAGSNSGGFYTRLDWLDELGLDMPETWEEFGDVFSQVLEANPNGKLTAGIGGTGTPDRVVQGYTGGFAMSEVMEYQGEYILAAYHPGAQDAVQLVSEWYQSGLLHPTAVAGDGIGPTEIMRIITDGNIATTWHVGLPGHWKTIYDGLSENDPGFDLGFVPIPAGPDGNRHYGGGAGYYGGLMVNSDYSSDMQGRAGKVIDYLFGSEGTNFLFDGIEGIHYTLQDGTKVPDEELRNRDFVGSVSNLIDLVDRSIAWEREANEVLANNFYDANSIAVQPQVIGLSTENYTELSLNIGEVIDQFLPKFYTGELSVQDDWDEMLDAIESAGLEDMLAEVQAFKAN